MAALQADDDRQLVLLRLLVGRHERSIPRRVDAAGLLHEHVLAGLDRCGVVDRPICSRSQQGFAAGACAAVAAADHANAEHVTASRVGTAAEVQAGRQRTGHRRHRDLPEKPASRRSTEILRLIVLRHVECSLGLHALALPYRRTKPASSPGWSLLRS
jgi:hypothetical protein